MSNMNYRNIAVREIKDFADQFPDYSLGQILYSIVRQATSDPSAIKGLRDLSDEQVYTMIDKAKELESE